MSNLRSLSLWTDKQPTPNEWNGNRNPRVATRDRGWLIRSIWRRLQRGIEWRTRRAVSRTHDCSRIQIKSVGSVCVHSVSPADTRFRIKFNIPPYPIMGEWPAALALALDQSCPAGFVWFRVVVSQTVIVTGRSRTVLASSRRRAFGIVARRRLGSVERQRQLLDHWAAFVGSRCIIKHAVGETINFSRFEDRSQFALWFDNLTEVVLLCSTACLLAFALDRRGHNFYPTLCRRITYGLHIVIRVIRSKKKIKSKSNDRITERCVVKRRRINYAEICPRKAILDAVSIRLMVCWKY